MCLPTLSRPKSFFYLILPETGQIDQVSGITPIQQPAMLSLVSRRLGIRSNSSQFAQRQATCEASDGYISLSFRQLSKVFGVRLGLLADKQNPRHISQLLLEIGQTHND